MWEPIAKEEVLRNLESLTPFERQEITDYVDDNVYFLGLSAEKVSPSSNDVTRFDDECGYYSVVLHDHINYQFEILRSINKGVFSEVVLAYDHKHQHEVAIKIYKNTQENHLVFYEETHKLHVLNEYYEDEFTMKMYDYFVFRGHPCIVFEVLLNSLDVELANNNFQGFSLPVIKEILVSVLHGLKNLKELGLVHCDLKPGNVLLVRKDNYKVKIADFGSSVFKNEDHLARHQCQSHCSPEILLKLPFGPASDMWSLGCMAIKLFTGRSPFVTKTDKKKMAKITSVIGIPNENILKASKVADKLFHTNGWPKYYWDNFTEAKKNKLTENIKWLNAVDLREILSESKSSLFIDFVKQCLVWEPSKRLTPEQALKHPWIKEKVADQ